MYINFKKYIEHFISNLLTVTLLTFDKANGGEQFKNKGLCAQAFVIEAEGDAGDCLVVLDDQIEPVFVIHDGPQTHN